MQVVSRGDSVVHVIRIGFQVAAESQRWRLAQPIAQQEGVAGGIAGPNRKIGQLQKGQQRGAAGDLIAVAASRRTSSSTRGKGAALQVY